MHLLEKQNKDIKSCFLRIFFVLIFAENKKKTSTSGVRKKSNFKSKLRVFFLPHLQIFFLFKNEKTTYLKSFCC